MQFRHILHLLLLSVTFATLCSCDDTETYAEQREREHGAIANFITGNTNVARKSLGGRAIQVITEEKFHAQGDSTSVEKNEFVLFENSGVYMQIVNKGGSGEILKQGGSADVNVRFNEYNLLGDSLSLTNKINSTHSYTERFSVANRTGTFYASFNSSTSLISAAYSSTSVPGGWLVPLTYIRLGRLSEGGLAEVRIIVPHDQGHAVASSNVCPFYYELTYQLCN